MPKETNLTEEIYNCQEKMSAQNAENLQAASTPQLTSNHIESSKLEKMSSKFDYEGEFGKLELVEGESSDSDYEDFNSSSISSLELFHDEFLLEKQSKQDFTTSSCTNGPFCWPGDW